LQRSVPFAVVAPGGQSGNFWIHHCMLFNQETCNGEESREWRYSSTHSEPQH